MCWFIYLNIKEQGNPNKKIKLIQEIIDEENKKQKNYRIEGTYPRFIITEGHCACNLVNKNDSSIKVNTEFLKNIISKHLVKYIEIGWSFGDPDTNPIDETKKQKMNINDFIENNQNNNLQDEILYHIIDPDNYYYNENIY